MNAWSRFWGWARMLLGEVPALACALRDPRTSWVARVLAALVVAYALSPVDLIPDFIPVLGLLDDLVIIPLGISLVIRLIPREVMDYWRAEVAGARSRMFGWAIAGSALVVGLWIILISAAGLFIGRALGWF
jgi:uncharacterized membrane protein YkvA (DUF1232 family)